MLCDVLDKTYKFLICYISHKGRKTFSGKKQNDGVIFEGGVKAET